MAVFTHEVKPIYFDEVIAYDEAKKLSKSVKYAVYINSNEHGFFPSCFMYYEGQPYYLDGEFINPGEF